MDPGELRGTLEARVGDELADLESPAALEALCDGEPTRQAVLRATWAGERAAAETFARWAGTATEADARATYEETAARERAHARRVASLLEDPPADTGPARPGPLHAYLRGLEALPARLGAGLVGRPLASLRTYSRVRRYAEETGDDALGECFGRLRSDTERTAATGGERIGSLAAVETARDDAIDAAAYAVRVIHDDYADALAERGRSFR